MAAASYGLNAVELMPVCLRGSLAGGNVKNEGSDCVNADANRGFVAVVTFMQIIFLYGRRCGLSLQDAE